MKLLVLDNYDSFTYNLVHLIEKVSTIPFDVFRNDAISPADVTPYDKVLLSPGPGLPKDAGIMPQLIKTYGSTKSIFGVCLGMQAIGEAYGATLKNLKEVCHGQARPLMVTQKEMLFENCPASFHVGRYHSWVVDQVKLPQELTITAIDEEGNIMALRHRDFNVCGVQFHPESILSQYGETIMANWLNS